MLLTPSMRKPPRVPSCMPMMSEGTRMPLTRPMMVPEIRPQVQAT